VMLLSFGVNLFFAEIMKWCMLGENHVPYVFAADGRRIRFRLGSSIRERCVVRPREVRIS
jgi:hypothetical protein